jgi:hypothetical protein
MGIEIITLGMKPVIQGQKSLGLVKEKKILTFIGHNPARFTKSCELGGGISHDADGRLVCGDSKFDVKKHPTCPWSLCGGVGSDESDNLYRIAIARSVGGVWANQEQDGVQFQQCPVIAAECC